MNLYRSVRSFAGKNFLQPFMDFCALNYPALYEFIFYNVYHKTQREDCGEVYFLRVNDLEDFVQLKRKNDLASKVPLDFSSPVDLKIAAIVHIFYPELAGELKNLLLNIPCAVDVFISTTSPEKFLKIAGGILPRRSSGSRRFIKITTCAFICTAKNLRTPKDASRVGATSSTKIFWAVPKLSAVS